MSKNNRKEVYDRLVKAGELWKDDGALVKEFGQAPTAAIKEPVEQKKKGKK